MENSQQILIQHHQVINGAIAIAVHVPDQTIVDVTADVLEDAVVVVVVVWVSEVVVSAVVITEDVDAVPSSTNSLLNFAAYVCAVEPA